MLLRPLFGQCLLLDGAAWQMPSLIYVRFLKDILMLSIHFLVRLSSSVPHVYELSLEAKDEWDTWDIFPPVEIDVCSSLLVYFTVI